MEDHQLNCSNATSGRTVSYERGSLVVGIGDDGVGGVRSGTDRRCGASRSEGARANWSHGRGLWGGRA